jgi:hypothetical protein
MSKPSTSKATNIGIAFIVFMFSWIICVVIISASNPGQYSWLIALFTALVLGVVFYFVSDGVQKRSLAQQEKGAQKILAPALPAGETLLAFMKGYTGPGRTGMTLMFGALGDALVNAGRRKWYYVGLTRQYLALVEVKGKKPTGVQQVVRRGEISQLEWQKGAFKEPKLVIQFIADRMELRVDYNMLNRAKEIDRLWHNVV